MCSGRLLAAQGRIGSGYVGFVLRRALQTSASRMRAFGCRRSCITRKARCPGYGNLRPPQRNPLLNAPTSGSSGMPEKFPDASQPEPTPNCSVRIVGLFGLIESSARHLLCSVSAILSCVCRQGRTRRTGLRPPKTALRKGGPFHFNMPDALQTGQRHRIRRAGLVAHVDQVVFRYAQRAVVVVQFGDDLLAPGVVGQIVDIAQLLELLVERR